MPPKLTPAAIAGILDEFVTFAQANAATLAARDGTDALSSLRQLHSKEEQRFYQFVHKHRPRFTEAHRRRLADAFAHVEQARAAATDPAAPSAPRADSAARTRPQQTRAPEAASSPPDTSASGSPVAAELAARKRPHTSPASTHAAAASGTGTLAHWRRLEAEMG